MWLLWSVSFFSLFFYSLRDRWVAEPFQSKQTRKHTNNSPPCFTVPCSPYSAGPDAKKTPLGEQLKSNDRELLHDSSTDRLFPIRLDIGLPLTEKSTDSRRPVVEDMEVSFSKCGRLSYCGFQHSEDITCFLCEASLQLQGAQHLSSAAACVGVSFWKTHTHTPHTHSILFLYYNQSHLRENTKEQTCQTLISQSRLTVNQQNTHFPLAWPFPRRCV